MDGYFPTLSDSARRWIRLLLLVGVAVAIGAVLYRTRSVFATPALMALAIAYIVNPLVTWCARRWRLPRLATVSIVFLLLLALTISGGVYLGFQVAAQVEEFRGGFGSYADRLGEVIQRHTPQPSTAGATPWTSDLTENAVAFLRRHGTTIAEQASTYLSTTVANVLDLATLVLLVPLFTFFALWRFNDLVCAARDHLPAGSRDTVVHVVRTIDHAIAGFFRGRLIVCLVIGLLSGAGWVAADVPYGLLLGLLCGALSLVPFLSLLTLPPALLLAYANVPPDHDWKWPVIYAMAVYMAVQTLDSFVLSPYILGRSSGLHPVTTLVVLLIGGQLAGLLGMLLAIPVASTLRTLAAEFVLPEVRRRAGLAHPAAAPPAPAPNTDPRPAG